MNCSLARSLAVFATLAAFGVAPSSASAVDESSLGTYPRIVGDSALIDDSLPYKLRAVNLRTGKATVLSTPTEYVDRYSAVFDHGYLAATGDTTGGPSKSSYELFSSGKTGPKTLVSWPRLFDDRHYICPISWFPLSVDARGRVTALRRSLLPGAKAGSCIVKLSGTRLVRFGSDGSKKSLYLPVKYKRWLARSTFTLRGDRLALLQAGPHSRVAVLNLRTRTTTEFAPGRSTYGLAFVSSRSLLLTRDTRSKTVAKRFSTSGRAGQTIYAGGPAQVTACGKFTAVGTEDLIRIRDENGKTAFRRTPTNQFRNDPEVTCSGSFLHYSFSRDCSRCGALPPESKLLALGKL